MPIAPTPPDAIEEYTVACAEALLAGTLALMTGHVQARCCSHRQDLAEKIVLQLAVLCQDPLLSPGFKNLLWALRARWLALNMGSSIVPRPASDRALWHSSPRVLQ
jgi:hypothetical protein